MIDAPDILELFQSSLELFAKWPLVAISVGLDMVTLAPQAAITRNFRFWRRQADHSRTPLPLALLPLAALPKSLGYRRTTAGLFLNVQDSVVERTVSRSPILPIASEGRRF